MKCPEDVKSQCVEDVVTYVAVVSQQAVDNFEWDHSYDDGQYHQLACKLYNAILCAYINHPYDDYVIKDTQSP